MPMSWFAFVAPVAETASTSWFESPTILVVIVSIIGIILSAIGSIIAVVWILGNWKGTVDQRLKTVDQALSGFGEWKGRVEERLKSLGELLDEVRRELLGKRLIKANSPVSLTEYGEKISTFLRAKEWATRTATVVLSEVVNNAPFEIEAFSRTHVSASLDAEMTRQVSACAYEFGIEPDSVKSVLWVVLRDELIQRAEQTKSD